MAKTSTSTIRFERIYKLTEQICSIDPSVNFDQVVKQKKERWNILLEIWRNNSKKLGSNIFLNPFSHLFFGEYFTHKPHHTMQLLNEIETALLDDKEAFLVWSQSKVFQNALNTVFNKKYHPSAFCSLQVSQGIARLLKGKDIFFFSKAPIIGYYWPLRLADVQKHTSAAIHLKKRITKILPRSKKWLPEQWADYQFVCNRIHKLYGLDYSEDRRLMDPIFSLIEYSNNKTTKIYIPRIAEATINEALMKAIFGSAAETTILNLFKQASDFYDEDGIVTIDIRNSWIYHTINNWVYDNNHPYKNEARKLMFDFEAQRND